MKAKYIDDKKNEYELLGGNIELLKENNITYEIDSSNSLYIFTINKVVVASFELVDEVKDYAKELISYLKTNKIEVVMLTGDNEKVAQRISNELSIDKYLANQTPISKAEYIKDLRSQDKLVIMVGDGVNDSVALSNADVAIAMGTSADISMEVSDIVLLNSSLSSLQEAFVISSRTYKFIKQNLGISLIYNMITIPFAMFGYVIPLVAALSMSLSSLLVVLNSLRIIM
jgi:Cu+-exporting ATPase